MNRAKHPTLELSQRLQLTHSQPFLTLLGLVAAFLASVAVAAENKTGELPPLRVGVSPVLPPMVFKQGNQLVGVEVDLARALGDKLGRKVVFVELDWKDQTEALVAGKTDVIMSSMSMTSARQAVMSLTRPYFRIGQMALVRRGDRNKHLLGLIVPPGTKVAVIKATTGDFLVQREFPKAKPKTYTRGEDAARALMRGSVDLFVTDSTLVWYLAGTHAADGLTAAPVLLSEEMLAWGVRRGNDELLAAANQFIERANQDGTLMKTFRRWMAVE